jgi:hypothetical protein
MSILEELGDQCKVVFGDITGISWEIKRTSPPLQMHCIENSKQIIPEMKLRGLVPNFHIHVSVSDLYDPTIGLQTQYSKIGGQIVGIYKSV